MRQPKRPKISLCLIARNEAANLPRLMASVTGAVDEVIVVDTGSTDRTVFLAEQLGARVIESVWKDDFAAAKNIALSQATGQWILTVDADMALETGHARRVRQAVESGRARAYFVNIRSPRSDGMTIETVAHPWLFEAHPGVRFEGRVHETILPSLLANGLKPLPASINITHFGYASESDLKARAERDLRLLAQADEGDPFTIFYRARAYQRLGRLNEARQALQWVSVWPGIDSRLQANAWSLLMRLAPDTSSAAEAQAVIREAVSRYPADRMTLLAASDASIRLDDLRTAIGYMRKALTSPAYQSVGVEALDRPEPHVRLQLAECLTCVHEFEDALKEYELAIAGGLKTVNSYCSMGITYSVTRRPAEAEACFRQAMRVDRRSPEPHRQLGLLFVETGREAEALAELEQALALGSRALDVAATVSQLRQKRDSHEQTQPFPSNRSLGIAEGGRPK